MRADVDLADRASHRGSVGCAGIGDQFQQHDFAVCVDRGEVLDAAKAGIDHGSAQAARRRGSRERMGNAVRRVCVDLDARPAGQADVGVVQNQVRLVAVRVEPGLQVAETFQFLRRPGELHAAGEFLQVAHHRGGVDGGAQAGDLFIDHQTGLFSGGHGNGATSSGTGDDSKDLGQRASGHSSRLSGAAQLPVHKVGTIACDKFAHHAFPARRPRNRPPPNCARLTGPW